jgi:hypothetical protein
MGLAFALVWANLLLARALYAQESVRFAVTDIVGLEELHTEYGAFQKVLSAATGLDIRFFPVSNRTAAVEALKSRKIDLVLTGPAEYIIFQTRTNAYPDHRLLAARLLCSVGDHGRVASLVSRISSARKSFSATSARRPNISRPCNF